jgi:hypothetical protein
MTGSSLGRRLAVLFLLAGMIGCATPGPRQAPEPAPRAEGGEPVWQRVRLRIRWDRANAPRWHIDALLAHRVAAPALERERNALALWRFHRRAADDATGHAFSTLTFAAPAVNARLCRDIESDRLVAALIAGGVLERVECEGFGPEKGGLVEATSDPRWSPELQRSWPYFIMGASQTWLRLIDEYARQALPAGGAQPVDETLAVYEQVNRAVTRTWQQEGHHAFLHHLNALFGYAPIDVGEASPRRF